MTVYHGISSLIEIIEMMIEIEGRLTFCSLTPTIEKTFHIMGAHAVRLDLPRRGDRDRRAHLADEPEGALGRIPRSLREVNDSLGGRGFGERQGREFKSSRPDH